MKDFLAKLSRILTRTELWVIVATILYVIKESGELDPEGAPYKTIVLAVAVLGSLGYGVLRTARKFSRDKVDAANGGK